MSVSSLVLSGTESEQKIARRFDFVHNSWSMTDVIVTRDNTSTSPTSVSISMMLDFGKGSHPITTSHILVSC